MSAATGRRPGSLGEEVAAVVELALSDLATFQEGLARILPQPKVALDRAAVASLLRDALAQYPPEPWVTPQGLQVMASPWLVALGYAKGGDAVLRRIASVLRG
jgi:hypothetical protein